MDIKYQLPSYNTYMATSTFKEDEKYFNKWNHRGDKNMTIEFWKNNIKNI